MLNSIIANYLARCYVDWLDTENFESNHISIMGFDMLNGYALVAHYSFQGAPIVNVISFDPYEFPDDSEIANSATVSVDLVTNPAVRCYDNALRLYLLSAGDDFGSLRLFGLDTYFIYDVDTLISQNEKYN